MSRPDVSDERIPQILDAAAQMFSQHGIDGASMLQIAETADVSKATIYHYFASKDELVVALTRRLFTEDEPMLEQLVKAQEPAHERLQQYVVDLVRLLEQNQTLYPLIAETYAAATRRPLLRELTQTYFDTYSAGFAQIIEQGQAAGDLRADLNARECALALVALIEGSILLARNIGKPMGEIVTPNVGVFLSAIQT
jgi:AcrR family transcriptional regulator